MTNEEELKYFIDLKWYDDHNRSFKAVAQARFCRSCRQRVGTEVQERVPTIDQKTGKVIFETRSARFGTNPFSVIRNCCAKTKGYITTETPTLEAVFRIFLANGNQPIGLESLQEQLAEWIPLDSKSHRFSPETIKDLIERDTYYGIRRFRLAEG
ncbi:MAG: hypothetical protein M1136_05320 [Chloroflexi bacterium]|nr:hypothetical protein [Chloroflexota bacterium]MCL5075057.1 hypothetical protein [Chloroflexota bacterium]